MIGLNHLGIGFVFTLVRMRMYCCYLEKLWTYHHDTSKFLSTNEVAIAQWMTPHQCLGGGGRHDKNFIVRVSLEILRMPLPISTNTRSGWPQSFSMCLPHKFHPQPHLRNSPWCRRGRRCLTLNFESLIACGCSCMFSTSFWSCVVDPTTGVILGCWEFSREGEKISTALANKQSEVRVR